MSSQARRNPLTFLYNHNPFYFLATLAILYGLHSVQELKLFDSVNGPLMLGLSLAGFVALLAAIGIGIVRYGGVWEDARSIILSILLIAFAVSVCIDSFCLSSPWLAANIAAIAFGFFILVGESIIRATGIRLPAGYRLPMYLLLGLMFLYPLVFGLEIVAINRENSSWLLYGFSLVSAVAILTLLPAVGRRKYYIANNGTPWQWPAYPWSIFAFLFLALGLRAYTMGMSFVPMEGLRTTIGSFFAVPPMLALMLLCLQNELAKGEKGDTEAVMFNAAFFIGLLTIPVIDSSGASWFAERFTESIGSPFWVSVAGLTAFYLIGWICNAAHAKSWFLASTIALGLIPNQSLGLFDPWAVHRILPLFLAGQILIQDAIKAKSTHRMAWALVPCALGMVVAVDSNTSLSQESNLMFVSTMYIAYLFGLSIFRNDVAAKRLRVFFGMSFPVSVAIGLLSFFAERISLESLLIGGTSILLASIFAATITRQKWFWIDALTTLGILLIAIVLGRSRYIDGVPTNAKLAFGAAFICISAGVLISSIKAGWLNETRTRLCAAFLEIWEPIENQIE